MSTVAPPVRDTHRAGVRIDPASGVREEATFVGIGRDEIFCMIYRPASPPRRAIVICPSILAEHASLHRAEVLAARAFAAQGWPVIRFHYRGTGHSGGPAEAATLTSMVDDARYAAEIAVSPATAGDAVFCGARWGGLVAGFAAASGPGTPLALWEPVIDGERYLTEVLRTQNVRAITQQVGLRITMSQVLEEIRTIGYADVLGFHLYRGLYESMDGRSLREIAGGPPRPVLLAHISPAGRWKPELVALKDTFVVGGSRLEPILISGEDPGGWSLDLRVQSTDALIAGTINWLRRLEAAP